ncbi:MAG: sigma 54-interacting transcriptional regulator [Planctomycetaceae bacterium]|nr:sigma 54-interacting transcriptional regulator [Planctomycetaceae bacterium]
MTYIESMHLMSTLGFGAALVSDDDYIIELNDAAERMLHGDGKLKGRSWSEAAPWFADTDNDAGYFNVSFYEYLAPCPAPEGVELPANSRLVCFRDAKNEVSHHMLETIVNLIREPIVLCDEKRRILLVNNALMQMESLVPENVVGKDINEAYACIDGNELTVPMVIESKNSFIDWRQTYTTYRGKRLDIVCNSHPILKNGKILGVFCMTADSSRVEALSKQIIDLQEALLERQGKAKTTSARKGPLSAKYTFDDIVHQSEVMDKLISHCMMSAKSDSPIMLYGETGTGKELLAQSIHNESNRKEGPFLAINCAAIPENLLESTLFGTEKGAYTGAESRPGLFEQADGGTLLLDELNSMSLALQAKLLRVLQDGMVRRVGAIIEKQVDVRVLSNTNVSPYQAIEENKLRHDVFYRLGVVNIKIPPLRERKEDILILTRFFFVNMNRKLSKNVSSVDDAVLSIFYAYTWPGNVRELQHCIEHAMNILPNDATVITKEYLPEHIMDEVNEPSSGQIETSGGGLVQLLSSVERAVLADAIVKNKGNISKAARQLEIGRQNLQHRLRRNNIDVQALLHEAGLEG